MIRCLMGIQPESADGTYPSGMQRPSYINLIETQFVFESSSRYQCLTHHLFVEANTIIYLFNLLCNDLINFKACTMREPAS